MNKRATKGRRLNIVLGEDTLLLLNEIQVLLKESNRSSCLSSIIIDTHKQLTSATAPAGMPAKDKLINVIKKNNVLLLKDLLSCY